jgi:glycerol-3-phosphate O-acyltransferase
MIEEHDGGKKAKESMLGLLRARKYLQSKFGSVHVSFGEPISLANALGSQRNAFEALQRGQIDSPEIAEDLEGRKREFVKDLGLSLVERIGWATVANSTSVAAVVLMGGVQSGLLRERLVKGMQDVAVLLKLQGVRITPALERDLGELRESVGFLERSDLIQSRLDHRGEILYFEDNRRRALDMYRNSIAHFLVIPSILARATLRGLEKIQVHDELKTWVDAFYLEYYVSRELYYARGEALLDHFESEGWITDDGDRWVATEAGQEPLSMLAEQTRGVVECYETIVRVLRPWMDSADDGLLRSGVIREANLAFESASLLGEVRRSEALADSTFDSALAWLVSRQILKSEVVATGKRNARDTRYARGEKWAELESIERFLAVALRDS